MQYFVSYMLEGDSTFTIGRAQIGREERIRDMEDVKGIEKKLSELNERKAVIITWRRFEL